MAMALRGGGDAGLAGREALGSPEARGAEVPDEPPRRVTRSSARRVSIEACDDSHPPPADLGKPAVAKPASKKRPAASTAPTARSAAKARIDDGKENAPPPGAGISGGKLPAPGRQGLSPRRPLADRIPQQPQVTEPGAGKPQLERVLAGKAEQQGQANPPPKDQHKAGQGQPVRKETLKRRRSERLNQGAGDAAQSPAQPWPPVRRSREPGPTPGKVAPVMGGMDPGKGRTALSGQKRPIGSPDREPMICGSPWMGSPAPDIDRSDAGDPLWCCDYATAIYDHYMRVEGCLRPDPDYMASMQSEINHRMRAVLVDWIVEVHTKLELMPETLFLTVNLIDRYLSRVCVTRKRLQLVGVAAMLVASKYEEIWPPEVRDLIEICDHAYTREDILELERSMLLKLGWKLTVPTAYHFLPRFLKAAGNKGDKHTSLVASYLIELGMLSYDVLKYKYSQVAAAAVYLARRIAKEADPYPHPLRKHATYRLEQIKPVVDELLDLVNRAGKDLTRAVHRKYSSRKQQGVATQLGNCCL